MALTNNQQAIELISRAKNILLVSREHPTVDAMSAMVAMSLLLKKIQKTFDAVLTDADPKIIPAFLHPPVRIEPRLGALRTFHIRVNLRDVPLSELSYDVKDGTLDIALVPKTAAWTTQDVTFRQGEDRYDLIICFDAPDLASLGRLSREHAEFFYHTAVVNIDHQPTNEHWGQVNLVDLNAVSVTETLAHWIGEWNKTLIDEEMATALLAGMYAKTRGFRTANITPRTLTAASELVGMGAKREEIVHGLWRTRTVSALKLWGRALSRLEQDRDLGFVWTALAETDLLECGVPHAELDGVVDELIAYAPAANVVALLRQDRQTVRVDLYAQTTHSAAELARAFGGSGTRDRASFIFQTPGTYVEQTAAIVERLKNLLRMAK